MTDMVNNPPHYQLGNGMEVIDIIEAALTEEEFRGYLKGNDLKYIYREPHKGNSEQDVAKSIWYAERYKEALAKKAAKKKSVPVTVIPVDVREKEAGEEKRTVSFRLSTESIHDLIAVSSQQNHPAYHDYQLVLTWEKK